MPTTRIEQQGDRQAVHRVVEAAFGREDEARLVEALRKSSAFIPGLSLVALEGGEVVGHVLFTRLTVSGAGVARPALALAPLAVLPAWQNRSVGSALVLRGLADARELGHQVVLVLGHPKYYPRFGFQPAQPLGIRPPFEARADAFLVLGLQPGALAGFHGEVQYPPEFGIETLEERIRRVVREEVAICPYDQGWPESFREESTHLRSCLPPDLLGRIEHFGSTAVPGLAAKPIVDMLVEVTDLQAARERIAPILASQGYDYFWRPTHGDDGPPFYAWFIKREPGTGARTHHIHMVESGFTGHWDRLLFRDYLIEHPDVAREYEGLKIRVAASTPDRVAYTQGKTEFIARVTAQAKRHYARRLGEP